MKKTILLNASAKLASVMKKVRTEIIFPFKEEPSTKQFEPTPGSKEPVSKEAGELKALDLFSLFTADIIREKTVFTR